jgi:hypothetical protein
MSRWAYAPARSWNWKKWRTAPHINFRITLSPNVEAPQIKCHYFFLVLVHLLLHDSHCKSSNYSFTGKFIVIKCDKICHWELLWACWHMPEEVQKHKSRNRVEALSIVFSSTDNIFLWPLFRWSWVVSFVPWLSPTASLDAEEWEIPVPSHQVCSLVITLTELRQLLKHICSTTTHEITMNTASTFQNYDLVRREHG